MSKWICSLTIIIFLLTACSSPRAATEAGSSPEQANPTTKPATATAIDTSASPTLKATSIPESTRTATFTEITNVVDARSSNSVDYAPASLGQILKVSGEARTGEDGKARLDLAPEGTIIRVAPNTIFTVLELSGDETNPKSKLELLFGKIFILLKGGSLDVQTPSGVASVRGSLLGVFYNPDTKVLSATCLEGHCSLGDNDEYIELTEGQAADIFDGELSDEPRFMTADELGEWLEEAPELRDFIDELPDIPGLPDDFDFGPDFNPDATPEGPGDGTPPTPPDWPGPRR